MGVGLEMPGDAAAGITVEQLVATAESVPADDEVRVRIRVRVSLTLTLTLTQTPTLTLTLTLTPDRTGKRREWHDEHQ